MFARFDEILSRLSLSTFTRPLSRASWLVLDPADVGGSIIVLTNAEVFSFMTLARFDDSLYEPNLGYLSMSWALDEYIFNAHVNYAWLLRMYREPDEFFQTTEPVLKKMFPLRLIVGEALKTAKPQVKPFYEEINAIASRPPLQLNVNWLDIDGLGVMGAYGWTMRDAVLQAYHGDRLRFGVGTHVVYDRRGFGHRNVNGVLRYVTALDQEPEDAVGLSWRHYMELWGASELKDFVDDHPVIVLRYPFPIADREVKTLIDLNSLNPSPFPLLLTGSEITRAIQPIVVGWSWEERYVREGGNRESAWFRAPYSPVGMPFRLLAQQSYDDYRRAFVYDRIQKKPNDTIKFIAVL
jgi:hypothetical protein